MEELRGGLHIGEIIPDEEEHKFVQPINQHPEVVQGEYAVAGNPFHDELPGLNSGENKAPHQKTLSEPPPKERDTPKTRAEKKRFRKQDKENLQIPAPLNMFASHSTEMGKTAPHENAKLNGNVKVKRTRNGVMGRLPRILSSIFLGMTVGALIVGWIISIVGPWQLTNAGVVSRTIQAPINNIPAGTNISITQIGTVKPALPASLISYITDTASAEIISPVYNKNNVVTGYTIQCLSGSCTQGLLFDIPIESIIGQLD